MSVIYPLHFHRRVDRLWTLREKHRRTAPVFATNDRRGGGRCECGRRSTAPSMSVYVRPGLIEHHWTCAGCGGSGVPRLLFHWDPSQSMLQNESRVYGVIYT
jgi:hypothetical protein